MRCAIQGLFAMLLFAHSTAFAQDYCPPMPKAEKE